MAIEAPVSKIRIINLKIYIVGLLIMGAWFAYDGYLNKNFVEKHAKEGIADSSLVFNKMAPLFLLGAVVALAIYLAAIRNKKLVADDSRLIVSGKLTIPYDSIVKIDKTHFNDKGGFFLITYKSEQNTEKQVKISDRKYDNLSQVLDRLIEKIS
jgi:hypothetical protein